LTNNPTSKKSQMLLNWGYGTFASIRFPAKPIFGPTVQVHNRKNRDLFALQLVDDTVWITSDPATAGTP
jgi:hypothetical protein